MTGKELNMKEISEILRLKSLGFSKRKISKILGIHRNTISKYFENENRISTRNKLPEKDVKESLPATAAWKEKID